MSLQPLCDQVHAHRRGLAQDRETAPIGRGAPEQLRAEAQRLIGGVADAEHPLVAAHRAHAAAHLVGQGLEAEAVVGRGQGAGDGVARAVRGLRAARKTSIASSKRRLQQVGVAVERDEPGGGAGRA